MTRNIGCTKTLTKEVKENAEKNNIFFVDKNFIAIKILEKINNENDLQGLTAAFTSANGIKGFLQLLKNKQINPNQIECYCIKGKTSKTALSYGLKIKGLAFSGAALAEEIIKNKEKKIIHYTSNLKREELNTTLKQHAIQYQAVEVYKKSITPHLLENISAIVFFSPSQIDSFYLKNQFENKNPAFCIGPTTAKHLKSKGHKNIIVADAPSEESILQTILKYYKK